MSSGTEGSPLSAPAHRLGPRSLLSPPLTAVRQTGSVVSLCSAPSTPPSHFPRLRPPPPQYLVQAPASLVTAPLFTPPLSLQLGSYDTAMKPQRPSAVSPLPPLPARLPRFRWSVSTYTGRGLQGDCSLELLVYPFCLILVSFHGETVGIRGNRGFHMWGHCGLSRSGSPIGFSDHPSTSFRHHSQVPPSTRKCHSRPHPSEVLTFITQVTTIQSKNM